MMFDVPKLERYFVFPYFGFQSEALKRELTELLSKVYPFMNSRIILVNQFSIGSFLGTRTHFLKTVIRLWYTHFVLPRMGHLT